jgi:hypothetical protein
MKKGIFLILIFGFVIQSKAQNDTIFNKDFNDQDIVSGGWSNELVSGSENCFWDIFVSANSAARVSNYSSGQNQACESWLISPSVDLTNSNPFLSFRSSYNFSGDPLAILISSDYVAGDPSLASWTDISSMANMPAVDGFVWANSGLIDLSLYTMENIHVAFKYVGGDNDGKTWNLDDVILLSTQNIDPQGWNCINNSCQESVLGMGEYTTLTDCQQACESIQNPIISIYEIQFSEDVEANSPLEGQMVFTGGIVTAVKSDTTSFFIQNGSGPWNGIYVYDNMNFPQVGDSVTFNAEVEEFYNLTELKNVSDFVIVSSNNSVVFTEVTNEMANTEPFEGVLVRLLSVECNSVLNQYDEWSVSDGTNNVIVSDFLYIYTPVLNQTYNVSGVVDYSFDEFKVCPRDESDIVLSSASNILDQNIASLDLFPNPSNGIINIQEFGKFEVFSTSGQLVFSSKVNHTIVNLKIAKGTYFCKLYDEDGLLKGMEKLIVF